MLCHHRRPGGDFVLALWHIRENATLLPFMGGSVFYDVVIGCIPYLPQITITSNFAESTYGLR